MKQNTSWDKQAEWYDNLLSQNPNSYQERVIKPNLLRLMNIKSGEKVLDLACGNGFFSFAFAKAGAEVIGIDIAPKLIKIAQEKYSKYPNLKFHVGSASALPTSAIAKDGSFDQIACVMAIQNIDNVKGLLAEAKRVLKPGGKLHIVMSHPAFRVLKYSSWGWGENKPSNFTLPLRNSASGASNVKLLGKIQYRRIDKYLSESKVQIQMHPSVRRSSQAKATRDSDDITITFHRPLQYYFKLFKNTGFAVANLEEWISDKVSEPGPRAEVENRIRQEIPLFIYIQATRL